MKSSDYAEPSPACDLLRAHLREIWKPIDWSTVTADPEIFDTSGRVMLVTPTTYHTASTLAREIGVSVMTITRLVHRGVIRPARTPSGTMLFSATDIETIKNHLTK